MTQLRLFASLGLAVVVGCSPTNLSPPPPASDAGAQSDGADAGASPSDAGTPPADVTTDVPAIVCVSDRDCSADGLVCALAQGRCVQCNAAMDCASGQVCLRNACVTTVACTTSRMCPGQVCSQRLGYCVDCEADNDCPAADHCVASVCVPRPTTCTTDSQCSPMGRVCDRATGVCVACNVDTDCGATGWCGGDHTCRARACTPGTMMCPDATRQSVCDARGVGYTVTSCASGESCREGRCQPTSCTPGAMSCDPMTGARRVCAADGSGFTPSPCPSGQTCSMGTCVAPVCTPGSAVCASATERSVCNPDGLSATRSPCPAVTNSDATCAAGACGFACRSGFGDCDGMASNGCEANFASSNGDCGACGRTCPSGQNCVGGTCSAATGRPITRFTTMNCETIDHFSITGDDYGAVFASLDTVFVTGRDATARFDAVGLTNARPIANRQVAPLTDRATGQLYALLSASGSQITSANSTAVAIAPVDPTTGAVSPTRTMLSIQLRLTSTPMIFSGRGHAVIQVGGNGWANVELSSGEVTWLSNGPPFVHRYCAGWAAWGIAERIGGETFVVFIVDRTTIVRRNVRTATTTVLGTFSDLGDMCSIAVSEDLRRWYFHVEGPSQFGGTAASELLGACDLTF